MRLTGLDWGVGTLNGCIFKIYCVASGNISIWLSPPKSAFGSDVNGSLSLSGVSLCEPGHHAGTL